MEVVPIEKTTGAKWSETKALKKALEIEEPSNVAVRSITFDNVNNMWTIEWVDILDGDRFTTDVSDE